jgi:hypothetical protein
MYGYEYAGYMVISSCGTEQFLANIMKNKKKLFDPYRRRNGRSMEVYGC